jgi:hypothetical protein
MKISLLLSIIIAVVLSYYVNAAASTLPLPVCDHNPDSLTGFGETKLWFFYFSCDNAADGVCPEEYQDAFAPIVADCSTCIDPDCVGTLKGTVSDYQGYLVDGAIVTAHPIRYDVTAPSLEKSVLTNNNGEFSFLVPTGKYYFSAAKDNYDTELKYATILRGKETTMNFNLLNGTCHDDCTNSYGRCNAACDGMEFENGAKECRFENDIAKQKCNNRLKGTDIFYQEDATDKQNYAYFLECCEGSPIRKYYSSVVLDSSNVRDLVQIEKAANLLGDPVKIVVAVFKPK